MLALARLQRKLPARWSLRTARRRRSSGGPRLDGALMASTGRTATTKAMGKGSTQFQHLVQTEVPPQAARANGWRPGAGTTSCRRRYCVELRPHTAGSELLELSRQ